MHPITPIVTTDGLYVFMEPKSPKGADLRARRHYALHNGVPDSAGTGGEVWLWGEARPVDDGATRALVASAASYDPADRYVLFELLVVGARCLGYGDIELPENLRWSAT